MALSQNWNPSHMQLFLVDNKKIWDRSEHNALTDLVRFKGKWFCCFRESNAHVFGKNGTIRLLVSQDGIVWNAAASLAVEGIDLRDPKLSITAEKKLMLLAGGSEYRGKEYVRRQPMVTFSQNGEAWDPLQKILFPHEWLWRLTWFDSYGYGVSYTFTDPKDQNKEWLVKLFRTGNGRDFELIKQWNISGKPNECTLRFQQDGTMVALLRRDGFRQRCALVGHSPPPYTEWQWRESSHHIGGPNFIILPSQNMIAAGRIEARTPYGYFEKTALFRMSLNAITPLLYLPSGGIDCSYPGLVLHEGKLWVSYYSSHEGKTAIYLATLRIHDEETPPQKNLDGI